jgi:hypothetical protein
MVKNKWLRIRVGEYSLSHTNSKDFRPSGLHNFCHIYLLLLLYCKSSHRWQVNQWMCSLRIRPHLLKQAVGQSWSKVHGCQTLTQDKLIAVWLEGRGKKSSTVKSDLSELVSHIQSFSFTSHPRALLPPITPTPKALIKLPLIAAI